MGRNTRWAIWMTIGGLVTTAVVWAVTDSIWWGVAGLLGSGVVFNMLFRPAAPRWERVGHGRQERGTS